MKNLFEKDDKGTAKNAPLALRMRPGNLKEFVGQKHILGPGKLLKRIIDADKISSLIAEGGRIHHLQVSHYADQP